MSSLPNIQTYNRAWIGFVVQLKTHGTILVVYPNCEELILRQSCDRKTKISRAVEKHEIVLLLRSLQ